MTVSCTILLLIKRSASVQHPCYRAVFKNTCKILPLSMKTTFLKEMCHCLCISTKWKKGRNVRIEAAWIDMRLARKRTTFGATTSDGSNERKDGVFQQCCASRNNGIILIKHMWKRNTRNVHPFLSLLAFSPALSAWNALSLNVDTGATAESCSMPQMQENFETFFKKKRKCFHRETCTLVTVTLRLMSSFLL